MPSLRGLTPLAIFLLLGLTVFALDRWTDGDAGGRTVEVTEVSSPASGSGGRRSGTVRRTDQEIAELFGGHFAAALPDLTPGAWHRPIRSAMEVQSGQTARHVEGKCESRT